MKIVDVVMASLVCLTGCEVSRGELLLLLALASLQVADVGRLRCVRCGLGGESLHVMLSVLRKRGYVRAIGVRPCGFALTSEGEGVVRRFVSDVKVFCDE